MEIYLDKEKTKPAKQYEMDEDGRAIVRSGTWHVFGISKVFAYDQSTVFAYDQSTVYGAEQLSQHTKTVAVSLKNQFQYFFERTIKVKEQPSGE